MSNKRTPPPSAVPATREVRATPRVSPAFSLLQALIICLDAKAKVPTADIAFKLGVDRSYVIRLAAEGVPLAPTNAREDSILAIATSEDYARRIQNFGLKGLLGGENMPIVLAGNAEAPRPKLGPLTERRAAKEAAPAPEPAAEVKPKRGKKTLVIEDVAANKPIKGTVVDRGVGGDSVQGEVKPAKPRKGKKAAAITVQDVVDAMPKPKGRKSKPALASVPTDAPTADDILDL